MSTPAPIQSAADRELVKGMGLTSAIMLVMGSMIGSGIFIVSADIARLTSSPALLILAWVITAVMTVIGALSYAELGAMMPHTGGQYVYLRESLGPIWGFLYGWTYFLVIMTGTIAAVAIGFGKFLGVFFPAISSTAWIGGYVDVPMLGGTTAKMGLNTQNLVAILSIAVLTAINVRGVKLGAIVQDIFTFAKTAALLGLIALGLTIGANSDAIAANFGANFWQRFSWDAMFPITAGLDGHAAMVGVVAVLFLAQVGSLFSADAWNNVAAAAGEIENPRRNVALALSIGTGAVVLLYILANFAYLMVLPLEGIKTASEDRVATAVMQQMFGPTGAYLMALAILVSTFGCNNGLILGGARVYYAMAKDGLFFRPVAKVHPKFHTPHISLMAQGFWASVLCLTGTYGQLLDYTMFAVMIFYVLTIIGLFVLRRTRPGTPRPYKAFGYPVLPALYILMALYFDLMLLIYKPQYSWPGLIIVLVGIPVYLMWSRGAKPEHTLTS
jgi:APA family basic amino acid/polyamine antiporter